MPTFKKEYIKRTIILLMFFSLFPPATIMYLEPFSYLYMILNYSKCILILILFWKQNVRIKKEYLAILFFFIVLTLSSILGDLDITSLINNFFKIFGIYVICERYMDENPREFMFIGYLYFFLNLFFNDILMLFNHKGLFYVINSNGHIWYHFLAQKNSFSMFCFPLLVFSIVCYQNNIISKKLLLSAIVIACIPPIITKSVTTIIGIVVFVLILILLELNINFIYQKKLWIALIVILLVFQILFTFLLNTEIIQYIVINILHKDATLSGRTMIFSAAHELIGNNFLIGKGNGKDGYYFYVKVQQYKSGSIMWAHNTSLDLLVQGGILLLLSYYNIVYRAVKGLISEKLTKESIVIFSAMCVYLTMGLAERFDFRIDSYLILALAGCFGKLKFAGRESQRILKNERR